MSEEPKPDETGGAGSKEQVLADLAAERGKRQKAEEALAEAELKLSKAVEDHAETVAKLNATVEEKEAALEAASLQVERAQLLRDRDVPKDLDAFITGATVEEITASADRALEVFQSRQAAPEPPLSMRPDATQGAQEVALNGDAIESGLRAALNI